MLSKKKKNKIRELHSENKSIRKIAKQLHISPTTVSKFSKLTPEIQESKPETKTEKINLVPLKEESKEFTDTTQYPKAQPRSVSTGTVGGLSPSEYLNSIENIDKDYYKRGINPIKTIEKIDNDHQDKTNLYNQILQQQFERRGIPIPPPIPRATVAKPKNPEESIHQIIKEQKEKQRTKDIQSLRDKFIKGEKKHKEIIKKIEDIQNKKEEIDQNNIEPTPKQDKKNVTYVEKPKKTDKLIEKKEISKQIDTSLDENNLSQDQDNNKSGILDANLGIIIALEAFIEGCHVYSKHQSWKLAKKNKSQNQPIWVKVRGVKPENEIKLIPADNKVNKKPVKAIPIAKIIR